MKVNQATINFYLKTAKKLSDGSHPIMLRVCYHGFKDVSSHYSCTVKHWDKKNQCIKKGYPNFTVINYELNKLKTSIIARRDEFIRLGIEYTPQMLLDNTEQKKSILTNVVSDLMMIYADEKELKSGTKTAWKYSRNLIDEFHPNLIISEIDEGWCKRYGKWLENRTSEGNVRTQLGHIACIYKWAASKGLCDINNFPFKDWQYCHKYKPSVNLLYVHHKSVEVMKDIFLSKTIEMTSEKSFTYKYDGYIDYKDELFPLYFWLLGFLLQGLSPIDICMLKKGDFEIKEINGEDWYCIDTSRMKTSVGVKIRVKVHTIYSQVMIKRMLMSDGEWFLPIFHGLDGKDDVALKNRLRGVFGYWLNKGLKEWWKRINQVIIERNVDGAKIPLIDERCTFYSFRHSYAQAFLQKGGNVLAMATMLGRSINTISTYVQQLSEESELVDAASVMD